MINTFKFTEIKCPSCGRHLDKVKVTGVMLIARKCKSCKNNITTEITDGVITKNNIDGLENSRDIINPKRFKTTNP